MNKNSFGVHAAQRAEIHQPKATPWAFGNCSSSSSDKNCHQVTKIVTKHRPKTAKAEAEKGSNLIIP
jgi:hypothetical protein